MREELLLVSNFPEISEADYSAVPHDYDDLLSYYTRRGYRVIAIAGKSIEGLSWLKAQKMKRLDFKFSLVSWLLMICSGSKRSRIFVSSD